MSYYGFKVKPLVLKCKSKIRLLKMQKTKANIKPPEKPQELSVYSVATAFPPLCAVVHTDLVCYIVEWKKFTKVNVLFLV